MRSRWYALTKNKVTFDCDDSSVIQTVLEIDGSGRAVRTSKTGGVYENGAKQTGWNVSGAVFYDEKGRTVQEGMTEFIPGDLLSLLESEPKMTELYTSYEYDEKDRQVKTILPDFSEQSVSFEIKNNQLITSSKDPLGNITKQVSDSRGNIVCVEKLDGNGKSLTHVNYTYNIMSEMTAAYDAENHPVKVEYDMLGRKTALESLDSGRQEFFYDECSNLIVENNSVLREQGKEILYEYDGLNRLVKIDFPNTEDTVYIYGTSADENGAAGKIKSVTDASGTLEYEYGSLGEVTKEILPIKTYLNGGGEESSAMEYRSDYLGRMQFIVYPDSEKIIYGYDEGGQVVSVSGTNYGHDFDYVKDIGYDTYGQRVYIEYGNGVKTEYSYDSARRWLSSIKTQNKWGRCFQNISYNFDRVGNVLGYTNSCLVNASGNYSTSQTYSYDGLYQLVGVTGTTVYNPYNSPDSDYKSVNSQTFAFDDNGLGNMTSKLSRETVSPAKKIGDDLNYEIVYNYDLNFAHRLTNAGTRYYKYDSNGNIVLEKDGSFDEEVVQYTRMVKEEAENVYSTDYGWGLYAADESSGSNVDVYKRTYAWNEKNQLVSSVDSSFSTVYVYGEDGQRTNKYTSNSEIVYFNKMWTLHTDSGNANYGG